MSRCHPKETSGVCAPAWLAHLQTGVARGLLAVECGRIQIIGLASLYGSTPNGCAETVSCQSSCLEAGDSGRQRRRRSRYLLVLCYSMYCTGNGGAQNTGDNQLLRARYTRRRRAGPSRGCSWSTRSRTGQEGLACWGGGIVGGCRLQKNKEDCMQHLLCSTVQYCTIRPIQGACRSGQQAPRAACSDRAHSGIKSHHDRDNERKTLGWKSPIPCCAVLCCAVLYGSASFAVS